MRGTSQASRHGFDRERGPAYRRCSPRALLAAAGGLGRRGRVLDRPSIRTVCESRFSTGESVGQLEFHAALG